MSSVFGFYFIVTLLRQMNWSKRRSLFNSEAAVNSFVLDCAIDQMIDWSASISACHPKLALTFITKQIKKDKKIDCRCMKKRD